MKTTLLTLAVAVALGAAAGCDRTPEQRTPTTSTPTTTTPTPSTPAGSGGTATQSTTPTTPANTGTPSAAEKAEGSNPTQGQVDPKQSEQRKDFQQKGDSAGPKPGG